MIGKSVILFTFVKFIFCLTCESAKPPHIILVLGDDVGWNDFGFHGSNQIPTPNIDALGYNGIILHRYYTQHICTPSRAALLTGNYPIRSGMQGLPLKAGENRTIPLDMPVLPERLKELGYQTHLVGKWHLGYSYRETMPASRGFDSHFGYLNGYVGYFNYMIAQEMPDNSTIGGFDFINNFKPDWTVQGQYATELFTKKSLEIIDKHNTDMPLFLMLSHLAGHTGRNGSQLEVPDIRETERKYHYIEKPQRRRYADIVNIMDASVGKIMAKLSERNMLDNSIMLFISDNGAQTFGIYENFGSNWPLRGLKFTLLEGSIRGVGAIFSPLFKNKNYVNNELMHITDWLPTLYSAAGGNVKNLGKINGIDQWSMLSHNSPTERNEILANIDEVLNFSAIIGNRGRYKLVNGTFKNGIYDQYYGDEGRTGSPPYNVQEILNSETNKAIQKLSGIKPLTQENILETRADVDISWCRHNDNQPNLICTGICLFDLLNDPCETKNIINEEKEIGTELQKKLVEYYSTMVPQTNKRVDTRGDPKYCNGTWHPWLDLKTNHILASCIV